MAKAKGKSIFVKLMSAAGTGFFYVRIRPSFLSPALANIPPKLRPTGFYSLRYPRESQKQAKHTIS
jgi:hypothetical protein